MVLLQTPFGANIPHQRTNSPTGKPVVLLVLGQRPCIIILQPFNHRQGGHMV
jgi:hypothetical protein